MQYNDNPTLIALKSRGITIPSEPLDLSRIFKQEKVDRIYAITMTGRCGSTWLAATLNDIPYCGNPVEYFSNEGIPHFGRPDGSGELSQYFQSVVQEKKTGPVFGFKIDHFRLKWLSDVVDVGKTFSKESTAWIDMRRLNIVKQAFSFARAKKSGVWHIFANDVGSKANVSANAETASISFDSVWEEIHNIIQGENYIDKFYFELGVDPMRIFYEELLDSKAQIIRRVIAHIFPDRIFQESISEKDYTKKLSLNVDDPEEIAFCTRFIRDINEIYLKRSRLSARASV
jgi:LPS sulfotransferase NodH